ncbi:hypothetical protein [Streptomyces tsukubensis]|uniref:hypothetical protein n=1 Tax=Streptomyces tsukubensis TaxID=83656 RepID=UPI00344BC8CB
MSGTATVNRRALARRTRAAKVQESIARAVQCPLCPEVTPENGLDILTYALGPEGGHRWWNGTATIRERAMRLTADPRWCERALAWIDAYRAQHGHGPSWRQFWRAPDLWPTDTTVALLNCVMRQLNESGHLDGTKTPFGLRRRTAEPEGRRPSSLGQGPA